LEEFETGDRDAGRDVWVGERAWVAAVSGDRQKGRQLAQQAERDQPNGLALSAVWAELGETDRAMD
jgi:hypothetical protein